MSAQRVGVKNKALHDLRCNDEEAFRNSIDRRSAAALEDEKFPGEACVFYAWFEFLAMTTRLT